MFDVPDSLDSIREQLHRVPWRGPVVPAMHDSLPEHLPRLAGVVRAKVFNPEDPEDLSQYEAVLNRAESGSVQVLGERTNSLQDGTFRLFLVWKELYMCAPGYMPDEGRPIVRTNTGTELEYSGQQLDDELPEDVNAMRTTFATLMEEQREGKEAEEGERREAAKEPLPSPSWKPGGATFSYAPVGREQITHAQPPSAETAEDVDTQVDDSGTEQNAENNDA